MNSKGSSIQTGCWDNVRGLLSHLSLHTSTLGISSAASPIRQTCVCSSHPLASRAMKTTCFCLAIAVGLMLASCKNDNAPSPSSTTPTTPATTTTADKTPAVAPTKPAAAAANTVVGIKPGEMFAAACITIPVDSECGEIVVTSEADKAKVADGIKQLCSKGTVSTDKACPSDKMVGSCRVGKDMVNHYYADGPKAYAADTAKKKCEKGYGHWVE